MYSDCEALWLARLVAMAEFTADTTSRGNFRILNKGKAAQYAVLYPGETTREPIGLRLYLAKRETKIRLYQRLIDSGASLTNLETLADTVESTLAPFRVIGDTGGTIQRAAITARGEVTQTPAAAPKWLYIELTGVCDEEETIVFAE